MFLRTVRKFHTFQNIIFSKSEGVAIIKLNRPSALNALNKALCTDIGNAISLIEKDSEVKCTIITGEGPKSFAAGADIKEMSTQSYMDVYKSNLFGELSVLTTARKPVIAAVNGFALGGGCELAMACDIILASENAKFGQPEVKLGTIPGIGGTQRLTRAIGKSRAMEWILTGALYSAKDALEAGLVSRVVPQDQLMEVATKMAKEIAQYSTPILELAKECVNKSYEMTLTEGLNFETRVFQSTFATKDQKEGMSAFAEKRKANFKDE
jgi:enoyl-CoA hydratase/carnithine racemase